MKLYVCCTVFLVAMSIVGCQVRSTQIDYDVVVVGAGLTGLTLAERCATVLHKKVLIIEKRDHIGGNCHDCYDSAGILVPAYGPHFFHTSDERVWQYVNQWSEWVPYEFRALSFVDGSLVPIPVNITTVNRLFNTHLQSDDEMRAWLTEHTERIDVPRNGEEAALARVGRELYEKMFKYYTKKQWGKWPAKLMPLFLTVFLYARILMIDILVIPTKQCLEMGTTYSLITWFANLGLP